MLATVAFVVISVANFSSLTSAQAGAAWPTFHGTISRSGITSSAGPTGSAISNQWQLPAAVESSPAVDSTGVAYVGDDDNNVYALSPQSSTPKWSFKTGGKVVSSPTLSADGSTLFVGSEDGNVYSLSTSTGTKLWSVPVGGAVDGSPLLSPDGTTLFIATTTGEVWALKASNGTPVWSGKGYINLASSVTGSLALSPDGSILYVAAANQYMYGIVGAETATPAIDTTFYLAGPASSSPAVDANGNVYIGLLNGSLESFTPASSTPRWTYTDVARASIRSTPALAGSQIIFGTDDQNVYSVDARTGNQNWEAHTGGSVRSSPAISGNGYVYFGSDDGTFYALTTTGPLAWSQTVASAIDSSPAIGPDGSLWVGSQSGIVYRFGQPFTPTATATSTATATPIATATAISTSTATATNTPNPTSTPTDTATATATVVPKAPSIRTFRLLKVVGVRSRGRNWPVKNGTISLPARAKITFAVYVFVPQLHRQVTLRLRWTVTQGRRVAGHHQSVKKLSTGRSRDYVGHWTYTPRKAGQYEFRTTATLSDGITSVTRTETVAVHARK